MNVSQAYGTWTSPISASLVSSASVRSGDVKWAGGAAFWSEIRPSEKGRCVVVKSVDGNTTLDLLPEPYNARTRVHEYGGAAWWVDARYLYFVNWADQRLYRVEHDVSESELIAPIAITAAPQQEHAVRYADGCVSPDGSWIFCVREMHVGENNASEVVNDVIAIDNAAFSQTTNESSVNAEAANVHTITSGADFYSTPRLSPDATRLSWIEWNHPQMPWDGTQLKVADVEWLDNTPTIKNVSLVAGNDSTAIVSAFWNSLSELVFSSDESGWWNVYVRDFTQPSAVQLTHYSDCEVGVPPWALGTQRIVELCGGATTRLAALVTRNALDELHILDADGTSQIVATPYCAIDSIASDNAGNVFLSGSCTDQLSSVVCMPIFTSDKTRSQTQPALTFYKADAPLPFDSAWLSNAVPISFGSGESTSHAFFYPPAGKALCGLDDELPPLIVMGHGGPTGHATTALKLSVQFWTSRGVAVVDVNYRGSSGFGREYRRKLNGQWGVVDVEDCVG